MNDNSTETAIESVSDKSSKSDSKPNKNNSSNKTLTILGIVACIILAPILILNIILIIQGFTVDSNSIPNIGGTFPLIVKSGSMSGTIETGDLMFAHTAEDTSAFKKGDIIVYWDKAEGGSLVTHRIIEVTKDDNGKLAYRTKGDANATADAKLVYPEKIIGTYQGRIAGLGNVALFMQTIPGLIICVILPLAIFVIYDILRRRHIQKSEQTEAAALMAEIERLKSEKAKLESESKN